MSHTYIRIIGILLIGIPFLTRAQTGERDAVAIGVKGIANMAGIANQNNYGQNEMDYQFTLGLGGGVMLHYHLNSKSTIIGEVTYARGGQRYDDSFKGRHFEKEVRYKLISIPIAYRHRITQAEVGYSGVGAEVKPKWYVLGGLQLDRILSPDIQWYLDGQETDFLSFVLEGGNPNQAYLEAQGAPASGEDLFVDWDVQFIGGAGLEIQPYPTIVITAEIRGGIGLTDLNAKPWRVENNRGIYGASRNAFFGLHAGIAFLLAAQ